MRIAIYTRVSTSEQSEEIQLKDLREYAARRENALITEYHDTISGAKSSRPSLNRLMVAVRDNKFDMVLVWRFDRFARSTSFLLTALEEFKKLGVQFVSFQENIDTATPLGQAMFSILAAVSQLERDIIKERVAAGMRNAKAKGHRIGRKPRADRVEVEKLRKEGLSLRSIAEKLNTTATSIQRALRR